MTTDVRTAWNEVADQVEALALKLKLHAEEELSAASTDVQDSLQRLRDAAGTMADAMAQVGRDPAVRDDVRHIADTLVAALEATARKATELRR